MTAACITENVWPPMTRLAVRGAAAELAATVKLIVAGPVPLAGIPVIHAGTPLVVQLHAAVVVMLNALEPPAAVELWLEGFSE